MDSETESRLLVIKIKSERRSKKSCFTRSTNRLKYLMKHNSDNQTVQSNLLKASETLELVMKSNDELIKLLEDESLIEEAEEYIKELEDVFDNVEIETLEYMDRNKSRQTLDNNSSVSEHNTENNLERSGASNSNENIPMKRNHNPPNITLHKFYGDYVEWPRWFGLFQAIIDNNSTLSDTEKMVHLQTSLGGRALQSVYGFLCDGKLYNRAVETLKDRFGKEDDIVNSCMKSIFTFPPMKSIEKAVLEKFHGLLHCALVTLETMGFENDIKSSENLRRAVNKLPQELVRDWTKEIYGMNRRPTLLDFDKWLLREVDICRTTSYSVQRESYVKRETRMNNYIMKPGEPTSSYRRGKDSNVMKCPLCFQGHKLFNCQTFLNKSIDERNRYVKETNRCFSCLTYGHKLSKCFKRKQCTVIGCMKTHHPLLHEQSASDFENEVNSLEQSRIQDSDAQIVAAMKNETSVQEKSHVILQVVPIRVYGANNAFVDTYALLDSGSQTSLCSEELARKLQLKGELKLLTINNIEQNGNPKQVLRLNLKIKPNAKESSSAVIEVKEVWAIPKLNIRMPNVSAEIIQSFQHLRDLPMNFSYSGNVEVLLGANVMESLIQLDVRKGAPGQPIAIRTAFGWSITGQITHGQPGDGTGIHHLSCNDLNQSLQEWWSTESFGTKYNIQFPTSKEDRKAMNVLEETTKFKDNRYECKLLWKNEDVKMPDNYKMAFKRLQSTERNISKDALKATEYDKVFEDYLSKGYATKVPEENIVHSKRWFLPHHAVCNPNKKKLRVVFDAAATFQGVSLNNQLMTGPDFLQNLMTVLIRFRESDFGITADIEQMYHQIKVSTDDKPALSFLWRNMNTSKPPDVYNMNVVIFGACCSPAIANYAIKRTARDNEDSFSEESITAVKQNFYMDDFLRAEDSLEEAITRIEEVTKILKNGGFRLTKWASNNREVLKSVPRIERSKEFDLEMKNLPKVRALGVTWNTADDKFTFEINTIQVQQEMTKRNILKQCSSIFDPLGILTPFTIIAKLCIQRLWKESLNWDVTLSKETHADIIQLWRRWQQNLSLLGEVSIERSFMGNAQVTRRELHVFCDASEKAFGAVLYFRTVFEDNSVKIRFVMSKARVAPIKKLTIVRLEMQAAVLATRLANVVQKILTLKIAETFYWTDSKIVLGYIRNDVRRFQTFIGNRVAEIQDASSCNEWHHVPSENNPADNATRGLYILDLIQSNWLSGPAFLMKDGEEWPQEISKNDLQGQIDRSDPELKREIAFIQNERSRDDIFLNSDHYSNWKRYCRVVAFVNRARYAFKGNKRFGSLTVQEIGEAEILVVKAAQEKEWKNEIDCLRKKLPINRNSDILSLMPILDENGLLRASGRLTNAPLEITAKSPVLLPMKSDVTRMLILYYHHENFHNGTEMTLNDVRQKYWIPKGRSIVKSILRDCFRCRRRKIQPAQPVMSDLPKARFDTRYPFCSVGIDYFGPYLVKVRRKFEKRYGLLITCLSSRAVHLELAFGLDTESFLMAFRRFISRRGKPVCVYSDNGRSFICGQKELHEEVKRWNKSKIEEFMTQKEIEWHFNTPTASHMGGVWERLIRSVKRNLSIVIGSQILNDDVLATLFVEVEAILNSRPLTYVHTDYDEPEPLTPNHFLLGRATVNFPPGVFDDRDLKARKIWRRTQIMADHFWRRWVKEYVPTLLERKKWNTAQPNLKVGDIVILVDKHLPRCCWLLGIITNVFPGKDGYVRTAEVRTKTGTLKRPVNKLCQLNIDK